MLNIICEFLKPNIESQYWIDKYTLIGYCEKLHSSVCEFACKNKCPKTHEKGEKRTRKKELKAKRDLTSFMK